MQDFIKVVDYYLFIFINSKWVNPVFDVVFPAIRDKYFWAPLYIFLLFFFIINFKKKGYYLIILLILTIFVADQLSSSVLKPLIHRLRPCNDSYLHNYIRLLVSSSSSFSFPSSHASNHFAIAFFLIKIFSARFKWVFPVSLVWAAAISYAQVYVGLHFPLDIIAGAVLGAVIGISMGMFTNRFLKLNVDSL